MGIGELFRDVTVAPGEVKDLGDLKVVPHTEDRRETSAVARPLLMHPSPRLLGPLLADAQAPWDLRRVVHLHRRAGFAATWDELQRDLKDGPDASIDRLLNSTSRIRGVPDDFESIAALLADAAVAADDPARLKAWWVYRMLFGPDPLGERLTLIWHNHFATSNLKVDDLAAMRRQNDLFRSMARAPFGELLERRRPRPGAVDLARRPGQSQGAPQRKPRPRADGAVHAGHRPLHRERREGGRPRPDRLDGRRWCLPQRRRAARRRRQDNPRRSRAAWNGDDLVAMLLRSPGDRRSSGPAALRAVLRRRGVEPTIDRRSGGGPARAPPRHRPGGRDDPAVAGVLRRANLGIRVVEPGGVRHRPGAGAGAARPAPEHAGAGRLGGPAGSGPVLSAQRRRLARRPGLALDPRASSAGRIMRRHSSKAAASAGPSHSTRSRWPTRMPGPGPGRCGRVLRRAPPGGRAGPRLARADRDGRWGRSRRGAPTRPAAPSALILACPEAQMA